MALVNVVNMVVLDNPANILSPFQFEITFECLQELEDDLEWKVVYVGSAQDSVYDQVLDEILVGPVPVGINKFVLQVDAPNVHQLPAEEVLGVTVVLVTCSYKEREFVRVGYYVNNEYQYSPEELATFHQAQAQYQQALQLMQQQQQQPPPPLSSTTTTITTTTTSTSGVPTVDEDEGTAPNDNKQQLPPAPQLPPPPSPLDFGKVQRHILADKPRVTKFPIPWTLNDITNTTTTTTNNNNNNTTASHGARQDHATNGHDENAEDNNNNMETSFVKVEEEADEEEHGDDDGATAAADTDAHRIFKQQAMEEDEDDVQKGAATHGNDHDVEHDDLAGGATAPPHAMERPLLL